MPLDPQKLAKISAVVGVGLAALGVVLWINQRRALNATGFMGPNYRRVMGQADEAPVVSSYSDGRMSTEIRASENMSIEQRLATIQRKIHESIQDPEMRKLALDITADCPERDGMCEAKAIYKAVKKRIRYTGDIAPIKHPDGNVEGIDLYQSARRTWEFRGGDCDDAMILVGTLLTLNGITARARVTAETPDADDSHIYPVALLPKFSPEYAVALDTTLPGMNKFGVEVPAGRVTDFDA